MRRTRGIGSAGLAWRRRRDLDVGGGDAVSTAVERGQGSRVVDGLGEW
jgi:hypothetical protein